MAITILFTPEQQQNVVPKRFGVLRDGDAILEEHLRGISQPMNPETPAPLGAPRNDSNPQPPMSNLKRGK